MKKQTFMDNNYLIFFHDLINIKSDSKCDDTIFAQVTCVWSSVIQSIWKYLNYLDLCAVSLINKVTQFIQQIII